MPRNNGIYSPPPGTGGTPQTVISSTMFNAWVADITADQNNPRPIIAGGTGSATSQGAIDAFFGAPRTIVDERLLFVDPSDPTKCVRLDAGNVTAGQTRVLTMPDGDLNLGDLLPKSGGTMTGQLALMVGTTAAASLNIPAGVAPTAPVDGDLWGQSTGLLCHRTGVTYQLWDTGNLDKMPAAEAEAGTATTARVVDAAGINAAITKWRGVSRKTSDQSFTTQTFADVTGLAFSVEANEVWAFEAEVLFEKTVDNNAYPNIAINGPAGGYVRGGLHINMHQTSDLYGESAPVTGYDETPFSFALNGAVHGNARLWGYIEVGSTAGTVTIRGARNGTAGTATIKDGSILKAYRIS